MADFYARYCTAVVRHVHVVLMIIALMVSVNPIHQHSTLYHDTLHANLVDSEVALSGHKEIPLHSVTTHGSHKHSKTPIDETCCMASCAADFISNCTPFVKSLPGKKRIRFFAQDMISNPSTPRTRPPILFYSVS